MKTAWALREVEAFASLKSLSVLDKDALYARISSGEPVEYVLGSVTTKDLTLFIDRSVLIPRVETEILIEYALDRMDLKEANVLDLCTGSGVLGLSIKKRKPAFSVTLIDISKEALQIAEKNGKRNELEVEYILGNLMDPVDGRIFDYILCNPPYISEEEYRSLEGSVADFEPKIALVGGEDGLFFYRELARSLPRHLSSNGKVFFEIGSTQGVDVLEVFSGKEWRNQEILKDFAGLNRFLFVEKGE